MQVKVRDRTEELTCSYQDALRSIHPAAAAPLFLASSNIKVEIQQRRCHKQGLKINLVGILIEL